MAAGSGQEELPGVSSVWSHSVVSFLLSLFLYFSFQQQCPPTDLSFNFDANKQQRQLIAELENKNR